MAAIPPPGVTAYRNPFRSVPHLQPSRIDMGVDYFGTGPVYALGEGVVTEVDTSWAGGTGDVGPGTFIQYKLTSGPLAGYYVYLAEHVSPSVRPGQTVTSGTKLGTISGGIETGFGSGKPGLTAAMAAGQSLPPPQDPGGRPTAYGAAFSNVLAHFGAPRGINVHGEKPFGVLPQALVGALGTLGITGIPGSGGTALSGLGGLFGGLTEIGHFFGVLVSNLTDVHMWISLGWLLLGALLVFWGILLWLKVPQKSAGLAVAAAPAAA
jgi:hypothetical protein